MSVRGQRTHQASQMFSLFFLLLLIVVFPFFLDHTAVTGFSTVSSREKLRHIRAGAGNQRYSFCMVEKDSDKKQDIRGNQKDSWWSSFRTQEKQNDRSEWSLFQEAKDQEQSEEQDDEYDPFDSIVRIYCNSARPNYALPWQRHQQESSTASGFIIDDRTIITNAHAVESPLFVQVRRHGRDQRYKARVVAMGHECDLALVTVDDDAFWEGAEALRLGDLPKLEDEVRVVGYPLGGDGISVTAGVVSRVEMTLYEQARAELLSIQIDAAINGGNSGGPVFDEDGAVVGLAFQSLASEDVENVGFVIPASVVRHFLESVRRTGAYPGVCGLGVHFQNLENAALRRHLRLPAGTSGVRISDVGQVGPAAGVLEKDDVLCAIDGLPVANDGTIVASFGERVVLRAYFAERFEGDTVRLTVFRAGGFLEVAAAMAVPAHKVPVHFKDASPQYLVCGGLVFVAASLEYLETQDFWAPLSGEHRLNYEALYGAKEAPTDELVVLTQVLAHEANAGYEEVCNLHLLEFNERPVTSVAQLLRLLRSCEEETLRFRFFPNYLVVLDAAQAWAATAEICEQNSIPSAGVVWGEAAAAVGQAGDVEGSSGGSFLSQEVEGLHSRTPFAEKGKELEQEVLSLQSNSNKVSTGKKKTGDKQKSSLEDKAGKKNGGGGTKGNGSSSGGKKKTPDHHKNKKKPVDGEKSSSSGGKSGGDGVRKTGTSSSSSSL